MKMGAILWRTPTACRVETFSTHERKINCFSVYVRRSHLYEFFRRLLTHEAAAWVNTGVMSPRRAPK